MTHRNAHGVPSNVEMVNFVDDEVAIQVQRQVLN